MKSPKNFSNDQIRLLAKKTVDFILADNNKFALQTLKPILDAKCPFPKLDLLGMEIGKAGINQPIIFFKFFDETINYKTIGSFVIVGKAMIYFLKNNFDEVIKKSHEYIIKGDEWYYSDIIGHRTLGQALVDYFEKTLPFLDKFLQDKNKWIRKSVGIAIHCFSHEVLDKPEKIKKLLELIKPYIKDKQTEVVKGIGWGLKTIGKYYPDILVEFLRKQIKAKKKISKLMIKKALTYLNIEQKKKILI